MNKVCWLTIINRLLLAVSNSDVKELSSDSHTFVLRNECTFSWARIANCSLKGERESEVESLTALWMYTLLDVNWNLWKPPGANQNDYIQQEKYVSSHQHLITFSSISKHDKNSLLNLCGPFCQLGSLRY